MQVPNFDSEQSEIILGEQDWETFFNISDDRVTLS